MVGSPALFNGGKNLPQRRAEFILTGTDKAAEAEIFLNQLETAKGLRFFGIALGQGFKQGSGDYVEGHDLFIGAEGIYRPFTTPKGCIHRKSFSPSEG